jgi:hypothetical protein
MGFEDKIVAKLNKEIGSNVDTLGKGKDLVEKYVIQLNCIEEKVK